MLLAVRRAPQRRDIRQRPNAHGLPPTAAMSDLQTGSKSNLRSPSKLSSKSGLASKSALSSKSALRSQSRVSASANTTVAAAQGGLHRSGLCNTGHGDGGGWQLRAGSRARVGTDGFDEDAWMRAQKDPIKPPNQVPLPLVCRGGKGRRREGMEASACRQRLQPLTPRCGCQVPLTEDELKVEVTRILRADNPHAPDNIVRFSHKVPCRQPRCFLPAGTPTLCGALLCSLLRRSKLTVRCRAWTNVPSTLAFRAPW